MAIKNKKLKFRSNGFVRLILILILALPAGMIWITLHDYSGRFKIESLYSKKHKPFVGYYFLKNHRQIVNSLKNKFSFKLRTLVFGRNINLYFKLQWSGFLNIKEKLTVFLHYVFISLYNDVEKLAVV
jgi:hypothetical protein